MIHPRALPLIGLLTLTVACGPDASRGAAGAMGSAPADADATQSIAAILDGYFQAVEQKDLDAFLALLADPDDISIVTPAARLQSLEDLTEFFQSLQQAYAELHLRRGNVVMRTESSAAWVAFDWELDGAFADGSPARFTGWETQIHRKTADGWRIAHVHYSVPLVVPPTQ